MSKISDFLVSALIPMIESIGQTKLVEVLQKLHDTDLEKYKAAVIAGHTFIKPLKEYVAKTDTKIDDGLVAAIDEAISQSAAANGVVFE